MWRLEDEDCLQTCLLGQCEHFVFDFGHQIENIPVQCYVVVLYLTNIVYLPFATDLLTFCQPPEDSQQHHHRRQPPNHQMQRQPPNLKNIYGEHFGYRMLCFLSFLFLSHHLQRTNGCRVIVKDFEAQHFMHLLDGCVFLYRLGFFLELRLS